MLNSLKSNNSTILPNTAFDHGTKTATPDIQIEMQTTTAQLKKFGLDIQALTHQANSSSFSSDQAAKKVLDTLHHIATLLYLQWKRARQQRHSIKTLAMARLFNGVTHTARTLNNERHLIGMGHIEALATALKQGPSPDGFDPEYLARQMAQAAAHHTHEKAWLWVVLPTFKRQPYGRILLTKVDLPWGDHPIFITQPFFLAGQCTLFHTHGQNWALSHPLGSGGDKNTHLNTLWMPRSLDGPFPLIQVDYAEYNNDDIVVIQPRVIHGISRRRDTDAVPPSLSVLLDDENLRETLISQTRFGEQACLHVYCPHAPLVDELAQSPILKADNQFFIDYDMIVYDHVTQDIWSGGGGSWPRRMIEFGTTGEHCGICFEDDPRRENLDPRQVAQWFLELPPPPVIKYKVEAL